VSQRALVRGVLALLALTLVAVVALVAVTSQQDDPQPPPAELGLLPWTPRGGLSTDAELTQQAVDVWRAGVLTAGDAAPTPADDVYVLWAGPIGVGRLVLLQGLGADAAPLVAQVSERGDPATLVLDAVEPVPASEPAVLAATYDGNLDLPGLPVGTDADLVQLLTASTPEAVTRSFWLQGQTSANELDLLMVRDGMSEAFVHVGSSDDPGTPLVIADSVGGRAGVADTIEVRPRELFPGQAAVALVDAPPWGASGRIDGREYIDATLAAETLGFGTAAVREIASGTGEINGVQVSGRLVQVDPDPAAAHFVLIARDRVGVARCIATDGPVDTATLGADPAGGHLLVALQCVDPELDLLVTAVAASEGAGPILMSGTDGSIEPSERLVVVGSYRGQRAPIVATLANDANVTVTVTPAP